MAETERRSRRVLVVGTDETAASTVEERLSAADGALDTRTVAGIADGDREQVLQPGYSTGDEGSGFGLAIVQTIAAAHEWDVVVTESEEGGARFEFTGVESARVPA